VRTVRWLAALLVLAAGWAGVVGGHLLGYLAVHPEAYDRHRHLALTGHGWLGGALHSLLFVAPAAVLLAVAAVALAARSPRPPGPHPPLRRLAVVLAALQVPVFLLLECAERGFSVAATTGDPAVLVGLLAQVLVAAASATLFAGIRTAVVRLARPRRQALSPAQAPAPPRPLEDWTARIALLLTAPRRAPPTVPAG
jgi:lysylphosphatidylglycerol synthetase-like protein (DUF2156 family)